MSRAFIFIDGSNFYHKLKDLVEKTGVKHSLLDFHYGMFIEWLAKPHNLVCALLLK